MGFFLVECFKFLRKLELSLPLPVFSLVFSLKLQNKAGENHLKFYDFALRQVLSNITVHDMHFCDFLQRNKFNLVTLMQELSVSFWSTSVENEISVFYFLLKLYIYIYIYISKPFSKRTFWNKTMKTFQTTTPKQNAKNRI